MLLLNYGASSSQRNRRGYSAMHNAMSLNLVDIYRLFIIEDDYNLRDESWFMVCKCDEFIALFD